MASASIISSFIAWLRRRSTGSRASKPKPAPRVTMSPSAAPEQAIRLAWGAKVSSEFRRKVIAIAGRLSMDPDVLMAIMAFETGRSFNPGVVNRAGSGATGLIQFMPRTAKGLGTTTGKLAVMSAVDQLDYVERYLRPYAGRMNDLPSAYMAVLYPRAVDQPHEYVLFRKGSRAYKLNRGLDASGDGRVTKAEAAAKVGAMLSEGRRPGLIG